MSNRIAWQTASRGLDYRSCNHARFKERSAGEFFGTTLIQPARRTSSASGESSPGHRNFMMYFGRDQHAIVE